jgi:branched-chain amino acid transport system permease protein
LFVPKASWAELKAEIEVAAVVRTLAWTGGTALILCSAPLFFSYGFFMDVTSHFLIMGLFAVSLNLLIGYTGMVSLGHSAFFGIGAYTLGILLQKTTLAFPLVIGATILFSAAAALIIGFFCIRLGELYFAMLTLAFGQVVYGAIIKWGSLTGGDQGLVGGIPRPHIDLGFMVWNINVPENFYVLTVVVVMASMFFCKILVDSPFGAILKAIRENPERAYYSGLNVRRYQLGVFIIAGIFAGISGGLMAMYVSGAYPDFAYWSKSAEPIFMVVVGGLNTFAGPLVGAALLILLVSYLTMYTNLWALAFGTILVIFAVVIRRGVADIVMESKLVRRLFPYNQSQELGQGLPGKAVSGNEI